ncbi:MAG: YceI family protein [Saprospiraceae bacterium]
MKKIGFFLLSIALFAACQSDTPQQASTVEENHMDTLPVFTPASVTGAADYTVSEGTVYWSGKKATGRIHYGTLKVDRGTIQVNENQIVGGLVEIDMMSLDVSDIEEANERKDLIGHLQSDDFFDAAKYPKASFEIDEVLPSQNGKFNAIVRGSLKIKGVEKAINIPANVEISTDALVAKSVSFPINRTDYGVNFRSGILGTVKDRVIEDIVTISLELKAAKASN